LALTLHIIVILLLIATNVIIVLRYTRLGDQPKRSNGFQVYMEDLSGDANPCHAPTDISTIYLGTEWLVIYSILIA
jgi:hypothetical protein